MTVNSEKVLNFLKENYDKEFSKQQLADMLGISVPAVTGTMNALVKNGYAETVREEEVVVTEATETRKAVVKKIPYHKLTEAGLAYDPVAEEAAKQAAKAAKAAEKAAARAAAKAAKVAE